MTTSIPTMEQLEGQREATLSEIAHKISSVITGSIEPNSGITSAALECLQDYCAEEKGLPTSRRQEIRSTDVFKYLQSGKPEELMTLVLPLSEELFLSQFSERPVGNDGSFSDSGIERDILQRVRTSLNKGNDEQLCLVDIAINLFSNELSALWEPATYAARSRKRREAPGRKELRERQEDIVNANLKPT